MRIPVSLPFQQFTGYLSPVSGMGNNIFHLYSHDKFYYGALRLVEGEWRFNGNEPGWDELGEELGDIVTNWYQ